MNSSSIYLSLKACLMPIPFFAHSFCHEHSLCTLIVIIIIIIITLLMITILISFILWLFLSSCIIDDCIHSAVAAAAAAELLAEHGLLNEGTMLRPDLFLSHFLPFARLDPKTLPRPKVDPTTGQEGFPCPVCHKVLFCIISIKFKLNKQTNKQYDSYYIANIYKQWKRERWTWSE